MRRWERGLGLLPAALTAWVALPFLRPDRWVTGFDTLAYSGPNLVVSLGEIRHGRIPQWNTEIFGGVTHVGNAQVAAFEPSMWLLRDLPAHRALLTIIVLHLVVLTSGMWVLLRHRLRLSHAAAAVGAMTVAGSGVVMSRSIQFEQIAVVGWIPWVLVGCDLALDPSGSRRRLVVLPVTAALLVASGHPQQVYIAIPLVAAWCLGRWIDLRAGAHGVLRLAAGGALAAALAAAHLLPSVLALDDSAIAGGRTLEDVSNPLYSAQPSRMATIVLGDISAEDHPAAAGSFEALGFVGAAAAGLALLGLVRLPGRRDRWALAAMAAAAAFGGLCALGPRTPAYRALYDLLPGFDLARVPGRWMLLVVVGGAVLAAAGLDELRSGGLRSRAVAVAGGLGAATLVVARVGPFDAPRTAAWAWWAVAFVAVFGAALAASRGRGPAAALAALAAVLVAVELGVMSDASMARRLDEPRPFTELGDDLTSWLAERPGRSIALTDDRLGEPPYLVPALRPNANAAIGVPSIDGYDGGTQVTRRWVQSVPALAQDPFDPELPLRSQIATPVAPEVAARLGVRWLLVETVGRPPLGAIAPGWQQARRSGSRVLLENPAWSGEARVYRRSIGAPAADPSRALQTTEPGTVVLEEGTSPLRCTSACAPAAARVDRPHPGAIDVELPDGSAGGLLVVDEQLADGWSARVDGEPVDLEEANGLFLGVRVPPGASDVSLRYEAPGLRLGLVVSALALLAVLALLVPARPGPWRRGRGIS